MNPHGSKHILLIDSQQYWRESTTSALRSAGFSVNQHDMYNCVPPHNSMDGENPDLIVLGCNQIGPEEEDTINHILAQKHHLLVLCAFLPLQMMRSLFLRGVDDIADKPDDPHKVIVLVTVVLASLVPRNCYQAVERNGVA
jgi:DNA-binding response OmpR family regulator